MDEDEEPTTVYVAPSGDLRLLVERTCSISAVNTEIRSPKRKRAESSTSSSPERQQATSTKIFVVSSVVLCFASPVWKAMFDPQGHFMEATNSSTGTKEFRFEGDDPDALLILLQIAHLQFRKLPESLDYERLLNLAILCDKYDTVELIRPWVAKWEWPSKDFANKPGHEEWLFIAWAFGDTSTYEVLAKSLVQSTLSNTSGECLSSSSKLLGINMPPGAIG
ncbi:hypothetical protein MMC28_001608 [Mycoblastus sanguinarius]|nr:hypothetical protein [Mycoblastus sanguinarius]